MYRIYYIIWSYTTKNNFVFQTEAEKLEDNQERMMGYINNLRLKLKSISEKQNRMEAMMEAMLKANEIEWEVQEELDSI